MDELAKPGSTTNAYLISADSVAQCPCQFELTHKLVSQVLNWAGLKPREAALPKKKIGMNEKTPPCGDTTVLLSL